MCAVYIPTKGGLLAWVGRRFELLQINARIRWAEEDRDHLAMEVESGPRRLHQKDTDLAVLRVRQAVLRGTR